MLHKTNKSTNQPIHISAQRFYRLNVLIYANMYYVQGVKGSITEARATGVVYADLIHL